MDSPGWRAGASNLVLVAFVLAPLGGGCGTPSAHTVSRNYGLRPDLPVDPPRAHTPYDEDCANGGRLFKLYCGSCHNARPLGERPFSNYHVAITHMRDQAYLTGKEYRQIIMFLRRWDDVGPPTPDVGPSPKRFVYSQPIGEPNRDAAPTVPAPPPAGPGPWQGMRPPSAAAPQPASGAPVTSAPQPLPDLPALPQ